MNKEKSIAKEQIVDAAFEIIRKEGSLVLSTRKIAQQLGCSTQIIYKWYGTVDELRQDVIVKITDYLHTIIYSFQKTGNPFLDVEIGYVHAAYIEPILFQFIYIENALSVKLTDVIKDKRLLCVIRNDFRLPSQRKNRKTVLDNWLYAHGLAVLVASGVMPYDEEKIRHMLSAF